MRIAIISAVVLCCLFGLLVAMVATRPNSISVRRSVTMKAPVSVVFALINDLHRWPQWAPQDREDKTMKRTFAGPEAGVGAISDWTSRGSAGVGRMVITRSLSDDEIVVQVEFQTPFVAHNTNTFLIEEIPGGTRLTWSMTGTNVTLMKVMSLVISVDRMVGRHFENGLNNLKAVAETERPH